MADYSERLNFADYWIEDAMYVIEAPGFFVAKEVDMQASQKIMQQLREQDIKCTYTHIIVRAVSLALSRHPDLHQLITRRTRYYPENIDIGLSVSGDNVAAPILVLQNTATKTLRQVALEIIKRVPIIRAQDKQQTAQVRKWGWIIPFAWMRRALLRLASSNVPVIRKTAGTFQVTSVSRVDIHTPLKFGTSAVLSFGQVKERVVAHAGQPAVRLTVIIGLCANHRVWDGARAASLLDELTKILEEGELAREVYDSQANTR